KMDAEATACMRHDAPPPGGSDDRITSAALPLVEAAAETVSPGRGTHRLTMPTLDDEMLENAAAIERFLDTYLGNADHAILMGTPDRLLGAMRHGTLGGGKRLRPYILRLVAGIFDVAPERCIPAGAALE